MNGLGTSVFLVLLSAAAAALTSVVVAARRFSGKIKTSEASALWEEARDLRKQYKDDVVSFRAQLEECLARVDALEQQNEELHGENGDLRDKVRSLEAEVTKLRGENTTLKERLAELEGAAHA